ncbi:cold shock domain-containing protein [Bacillus sp. ISL-7]|uniref:cold shock domain-containing protein n=1 Tax=Bacillus sp. ISL-7 TaxID=2819136 RepID=UPI001BECC552|nr:cold shock domain-containing protein [Bacillus sp. ISL-7]MBT2738288.1 cold shock domain-containing protein [Bacillus sp. ISL-7]
MVTPFGQLQKWFPDQETIFIYITIVKITGDGFKSFDEGQRVQFDILKGQRGSQAENVSKI